MENPRFLKNKYKLYVELVGLYDGENVIDEHNIRLMDALIRDPDVQKIVVRQLKSLEWLDGLK